MEFIHENKYVFEKLKTETIDGKRHYVTPNGKYPSVTTVLSYFQKEGIKQWRERVGKEEATRVTVRAARRGTQVHLMAEDYLSNKTDFAARKMPSDVEMFNTIRGVLDKSIGKIYGLEVPLWSSELRVAGRSDCIAEFDGELSVVDFKTSNKYKKREWIDNYFEQGSCYAKMFEERTGQPVNKVVILIAVENGPYQLFVEDSTSYLNSAKEKILHYEKVREQKRQDLLRESRE